MGREALGRGKRCRSAALLWVSLGACVPATPSSAEDRRWLEPTVAPASVCDADRLARFDPGLVVVAREALPPIQQATLDERVLAVTLDCDEDEADDACLRRSRAEVAEAFPDATRIEAAIGYDRYVIAVSLEESGVATKARFDDVEALAAHLREREEAGSPAKVVETEQVPAEDAKHQATLRAFQPGRTVAREGLRASVTVAPPEDHLAAVLLLQRRVAEAGLSIHAVHPLEGGGLRIDYGCTRGAPE
ncbi:MAG: hypothetical protein R3B72_40000 [Polyangiaceae bacterium]